MWHKQSRPDRDGYIRVLYDNIEPDKRFAFDKQNSYEVDYQGTTYDYRSVMHYSRNAFSRNTLNTIVVTNNAEYNRQGRPNLGSHSKIQFSNTDAFQLNRMYNCPGSGIPGILKVYVKYGQGLPDRDGWFAGDSFFVYNSFCR